MRKLRIFGDSHVGVLYWGWKQHPKISAALPFEIEFYSRHGANWFEFETTNVDGKLHFHGDRLHQSPQEAPVDYTVDNPEDIHVFSSPLHSCTVYRDASWKTYCPWDCGPANPDLQALSTSVIEAWSRAQIDCRVSALEAIKALGYTIAVVEPPKPLTRTPALYSLRRDVLASADRIYRGFVCDRLAAGGIPVISVPDNTHVDGFTTEKYSASPATDPHHGSMLFAAEMMDKIIHFGESHA